MNAIIALLAVLGAAVGALFLKGKKLDDANALLDNQKAKEGLNQVDKDLAKNQGLLEAEDQKRKEIGNASAQDLVDFVNNLKSK